MPPVAPTALPPVPRLLRRDFLLLWQGQLVSQVGNQAFLVVTAFWTLEATGSAALLGLLMMASALPGVILGPATGALADRRSRLGIVIVADVARGVAVLSLAAVLAWRPAAAGLTIGWLLAVALFNGVVDAFFRPAVAALVPDLVARERVAAANSLTQGSAQAAMILGQAAGGVAYRLLGAPWLLLVDGLTYLASAASETFIRAPAVPPRRAASLGAALADYRRDTLEGLAYVWARRGMRGFLAAAAAFNFFAMPIFVLLPFYVTGRLGRGPAWYGFLLAAMGAGALAGYAWGGLSAARGRARAARVLALFAVAAVTVVLLGAVRSPAGALLLFFALGAASGAINLAVLTLFQLAPAPEMRGRVLALVLAVSSAAAPLGMALGGLAGEAVEEVHRIYLACGVALLATAGLTAGRPSVREFLAGD